MLAQEKDEDRRRRLVVAIERSIQDESSANRKRKWYFRAGTERQLRLIIRLALLTCFTWFQGFYLTNDTSSWGQKVTFRQRCQRYARLSPSTKFFRLVLISLACFTVFTVPSIYYQFVYDINKVKVQYTEQIISNLQKGVMASVPACHNLSTLNSSLVAFARRAAYAESWLKVLGCAYIEWNFAMSIYLVISLVFTLVWVVLAVILMKFYELDYFAWTRWLLDAGGECRRWAGFIVCEIDLLADEMQLAMQSEFRSKRRVSDCIDLHQWQLHVRVCTDCNLCVSHQAYSSQFSGQEIVIGESSFLSCALRERLLNIVLQAPMKIPFNRTDEWLLELATLLVLAWFTLLCYDSLVLSMLHEYTRRVLTSKGVSIRMESLMDFRDLVCRAGLVFVLFIVAIAQVSCSHLTARDLWQTARRVKRLMLTTANQSERHYRELMRLLELQRVAAIDRGIGEQIGSLLNRLESDLMTIIIQYRLFQREFALATAHFKFYRFGFLITLIHPILCRLYGPYMAPELRPVIFAGGYTMLIPSYAYFVPLAHVHSVCLDTYATLHIVLSQAAHYDSLVRSGMHKFAIQMLRRELLEPKQAIKKFAFSLFGLQMNKPTLLRLSFWLSLILIPILQNRSKSENGLINTNDNDALRIYASIDECWQIQ